jgi:hypothetical protein
VLLELAAARAWQHIDFVVVSGTWQIRTASRRYVGRRGGTEVFDLKEVSV